MSLTHFLLLSFWHLRDFHHLMPLTRCTLFGLVLLSAVPSQLSWRQSRQKMSDGVQTWEGKTNEASCQCTPTKPICSSVKLWHIEQEEEQGEKNRHRAHVMPKLLMLFLLSHALAKTRITSPVKPSTVSKKISLKLQTISHTLSHALLELGRIIPPQPRRLNVSRTLVIRA